jgi:hypothetical protein
MRSWSAKRSFSLPAWSGSTDTDAKEKIESEVAELAGTMTRQQVALAERFIKDSLASHRRERPSMILRFCEGIKQPPAD